MEPVFKQIWELARPYLDTRINEIHTEIATSYAYELLEKEGGDKSIVIPAIILHDIGWKMIPEDIQIKGFGPKKKSIEVKRRHETEGVKIAKSILKKVNYDKIKTEEILDIIDGHGTRKEAISLNDKIVKDADKLWRFSERGIRIDSERFCMTIKELLQKKTMDIDNIFFTESAKDIAKEAIKKYLN
ncbi:MAG: HD domain-containing protein [Candidatus Aenigmarchaeota archaeon]|nr:HD domain-containing protein [Candidatus Aenigmarchaeota archaeon]MCK5234735.1 HD domain-containing protein [Candidatus Aenigmarchaeota archaeon]